MASKNSFVLGFVVIFVLSTGLLENGKGFNELQRQANGISSKVLSESLDDLQEKDIVEKEVKKDDTKNVEYRLTEKGQSLRPVIMEMLKWGKENKENI